MLSDKYSTSVFVGIFVVFQLILVGTIYYLDVTTDTIAPASLCTTNRPDLWNMTFNASSRSVLEEPCIPNRALEDTWFHISNTTVTNCVPRPTPPPRSKNISDDKKKGTRVTKFTQLFNKAYDALNKIGVKFFISHGTLLGWFRQCGIIGHTSDMDIGIPYYYMNKYKNAINTSMKAAGFKFGHTFGVLTSGFEMSFTMGGSRIDMFTFYKETFRNNGTEVDYLWNSMWRGDREMRKMYYPITEFAYTNFSGWNVLVPVKANEWIVTNYGENWKTSEPSWDWWNSPKNYITQEVFRDETKIYKDRSKTGKNVLKNPSFEDFAYINNKLVIPGWEVVSGNVKITNTSTFAGGYALYCINSQDKCTITQTVNLPLEISKKWVIAGYSKRDVTEKKNFRASVDWSVGYSMGKQAFTADFELTRPGWQYYSTGVTAQAINTMKITLQFNKFPGGVFFDEISVRPEVLCKDNCSNNGECIYGICHCYAGFTGASCKQA